MKILIKILATALLSYAILMLLLDGLFAFLSLSPQTNIWVLIEESLIPYSISIVSMLYCIICIWLHSVNSRK
jgi:hypothetical protein